MIPKFEYGAYYKFLVSVGIVLIAGALAFPIFALREPSDLLIPEADLAQLTEAAQSAVAWRQDLAGGLIRATPFVSGLLLMFGLAFVVIGLRRWRARQQVQDEVEDTELAKAKVDLRKATDEEVEAERQEEATDEVAAELASEVDEVAAPTAPTGDLAVRRQAWSRRAMDAELSVAGRLVGALDDRYRVESQIVLEMGSIRRYVDLLMRSRVVSTDILIEVKYVTSAKALSRRIREVTALLEDSRRLYESASSREAIGIGFIVLASSADGDDRLTARCRAAAADNRQLGYGVKVVCVKESELGEWSDDAWRRVILDDG